MRPGPPPASRRDDLVENLHGIEVADPYRWLEDGESEEVRAWTDAQNARTRAVLDALPGQDRLHRHLTGLFAAGVSGAPSFRGGRIFTIDRWGTLDQAVLVVRGADGPGPVAPRILVDPHELTGDATAAIDWFHPSRDGRLVAYGISTGGNERSTLRLLDVHRGVHLADEIPDTRAASVAWMPDGSAFAYTRYPPDGEYDRHVRWHALGTDPADDPVVFDDLPEPTAWPDVSASRDGRWLLIHVALGWSRIDLHLVDRESDTRTVVIEGEECINGFRVFDDRLVGHTTLGAGRGRIVTAALTAPTPEHWETLLPERDVVLDGFTATSDSLLVASTHRAVSRLERLPFGDGASAPAPEPERVELPEIGALAGLSGSEDSDAAAFSFTSWARPTTLYRWSPAGVDRWSDLPGGPDGGTYTVEQTEYPSTDGTAIPVFLIRRSETELTPDTACVLTGYGGFAVTMTPAYTPVGVTVADAGGLYAVACLRGGLEEGEEWHRAGMRERKQQVFDDLHAAADWLVDTGRTSRRRLAIRGGSNGGLLVGVALTQRPDLCHAVVCQVPLLDMVRYHHFLIAKLWIPEYGDPDVPEELAWLYAYSPYHHVADGTCYPATLIDTAEEDSRVDPAHARKMAARLQQATSCGDDHPILLRIETRAGHGQGKPVSKQADEYTDVLGFTFSQLGVTPALSTQ